MPKRVYGWDKDGEYESFIEHLPEGYSITDPNAETTEPPAETTEPPKRRGRPPKAQTEDGVTEAVKDTESSD